MRDDSAETSLDPRIRRTRRLLQDALSTLLADQPYSTISISDICREADVARVTFYQHYEHKDALLLAGVADFFATLYDAFEPAALDHFLATGDMGALAAAPPVDLTDPARVRLLAVALTHAGSAVRRLTLASFLDVYARHETQLDAQETVVLATFYVGGVLMLLEQFLTGRLALSAAQFQAAPLALLRALRQGALQSAILRGTAG